MAKADAPDDDDAADAPPIYKHASSKKLKDKGQQEAKKGDTVRGKELDGQPSEDESEWESIGEKYLDKDNNIKGDVDPDELKGTAKPDAKGNLVKEGKGWDDIRVKDSEGGRRREYFKRKQPPPTS